MEKKCRSSYNEIDDSLIISCREENEKSEENFIFDDIIFYLNKAGKIIGLQIRNTSSVLLESGINPDILNSLKETELIITPKQHSLYIGINLIPFKNEEKRFALGRIFIPKFIT